MVPGKVDERPPGSLCISRGQPAAARAEMKTGAHDIEADPQPQAAVGEVSQPLTPSGSVTREVVHLVSLGVLDETYHTASQASFRETSCMFRDSVRQEHSWYV